MFPLPITPWLKLGAGVLLAGFMWYSGYSFEAARFDRYKTQQLIETQSKERSYQLDKDRIEKEKNAQINRINNQLVDAISELRKRPSRTQDTTNGQSGTGAGLYAQDAEFLIREAARADKIRSGLEACYNQYDSIK